MKELCLQRSLYKYTALYLLLVKPGNILPDPIFPLSKTNEQLMSKITAVTEQNFHCHLLFKDIWWLHLKTALFFHAIHDDLKNCPAHTFSIVSNLLCCCTVDTEVISGNRHNWQRNLNMPRNTQGGWCFPVKLRTSTLWPIITEFDVWLLQYI